MSNTEDKKDGELKKIPRNPNVPIKDEEVDALLKKAAEQIAEQEKKDEKKNRENIDLKASDKKQEKKTSTSEESKKKDTEGKKTKDVQTEKDSKKTKDMKDDKDAKKSDVKEEKKDKRPESKEKQPEKEFKVEDDVYVTKKPEQKAKSASGKKVPEKNYKMTPGEVAGSIFEGIWTGLKIVVLLTIVTAIVGFFLSRDLMIRGRSGEQISKQNMNVAANTHSTRLEQREDGKSWNETVKKEKLTMEADDGKILVAQKIVINKANDNWVVILHGQNGNVEDIYDIGLYYASEGYNILMPDLRAHGESEGSYYGMGWLDRLDVINWIDVILDEHPSANVIIHGIDLGADTALMLSGEPLKESIKAIVAEGAYTSAWDAVKTEYKVRHPKWPVFPMMHMLNPVAKVWGGYTLTEADAVKQVRNTKVPILLIRGANDTYVTEAMTQELDQAIASEHEVLTIATGTHEDCRFAEPDTYYGKVMEFIEKHVK